jgi:hypothetical protein
LERQLAAADELAQSDHGLQGSSNETAWSKQAHYDSVCRDYSASKSSSLVMDSLAVVFSTMLRSRTPLVLDLIRHYAAMKIVGHIYITVHDPHVSQEVMDGFRARVHAHALRVEVTFLMQTVWQRLFAKSQTANIDRLTR